MADHPDPGVPAGRPAHPPAAPPRPPRPGPPPRFPPPPQPPAGTLFAAPPLRRSRRPLVLAVVAAVLLVGLGAAGGVVLLDRIRSTPTSVATPTFTGAPTAAPASTAPPAGAAPAPVVAVAPGVEHPATEQVRAVLGGYVTGIDARRYADAFAYLSPDSATARSGLATWAEGQSTTAIRDTTITAVRDRGANSVEVDVTFTSTQDATYGPGGQTCTHWRLAYDMVGPGPGWLIRGARTQAPPRSC